MTAPTTTPALAMRDLELAYGSRVIMRDINAEVRPGEVFVIMGGSGCGKSTLLRHLIGLHAPARGTIFYQGVNFTLASAEERQVLQRQFGVLFQQGALWSSMTLAENIALPLAQFTPLNAEEIQQLARFKLALVGLRGFEAYYPSEISGGMRKRAALARAMALDPAYLFFDEPSAGLDPLSSRRLDDLILELRDQLGATIVVVTHELASIFAIADRALFLDAATQTVRALGPPRELLAHSPDPVVREFLTRGEPARPLTSAAPSPA